MSKSPYVVASRLLDGILSEYFGKIHVLFHDFNELLPPASTPSQEIEQRSKFFMLLALHGLSDDYSPVRDQILEPVNFVTKFGHKIDRSP